MGEPRHRIAKDIHSTGCFIDITKATTQLRDSARLFFAFFKQYVDAMVNELFTGVEYGAYCAS